MARIPETEVMNNPASVDGYTLATQGGGMANFLMGKLIASTDNLVIADIGCGNFAYAPSLASIYPNSTFIGYDASALMLQKAQEIINPSKFSLAQVSPDDSEIPSQNFDIVISSLLLHQYLDPMVMWNTIARMGKTGSQFYVYDILRVEDADICNDIVQNFAPEVATAEFQSDYFNTLRAGFLVPEIEQQLLDAGLTATITTEEIYPNLVVVYVIGTIS
jgi:ubiquinone/menaquinone biosynthesis C-methylase UbiE